jgi:hypothetical protein
MDLDGAVKWRQQALQVGFQRVRYGSITIATYPMGQIGFMMCEKRANNNYSIMENRYNKMVTAKGHETTFYHPRLQQR